MKFRIRIGDWSGDGHGMQEPHIVESNKDSIEEIREAYFAAREKLPNCLCPENFMCDFEDGSLPRETYEEARARGYDLLKDRDPSAWVDEAEMLEYPDFGAEEMAEYVLWFIKQGDPSIELKLASDSVQDLSFYGSDEKGRHIGFIGYGLLR